MKSSASFNFYEYGNGSDTAVALVTGFGGKRKDLDQAAHGFAARGNDVVLYEYSPRVLLDGNADLLPDIIDDLSEDFASRTLGYQAVRFCGISLGGAIAANMQKLSEHDTIERGFFAATGGDAANIVLGNQWFRSLVLAAHHTDLHRTYKHNGYTIDDLRESWADLQTVPSTPFTLALGGLDRIMRQREVMKNAADWRTYNPDFSIIYAPNCNHVGTMNRFNHTVVDLAFGETKRVIQPARQMKQLASTAVGFTQKYRDTLLSQPSILAAAA